jgi:hypothetical protein
VPSPWVAGYRSQLLDGGSNLAAIGERPNKEESTPSHEPAEAQELKVSQDAPSIIHVRFAGHARCSAAAGIDKQGIYRSPSQMAWWSLLFDPGSV